jgi:hypothetical protein
MLNLSRADELDWGIFKNNFLRKANRDDGEKQNRLFYAEQ